MINPFLHRHAPEAVSLALIKIFFGSNFIIPFIFRCKKKRQPLIKEIAFDFHIIKRCHGFKSENKLYDISVKILMMLPVQIHYKLPKFFILKFLIFMSVQAWSKTGWHLPFFSQSNFTQKTRIKTERFGWHPNRSALLAAEEGFEPSQSESESLVLPLHYSAILVRGTRLELAR